MVRVVEQYLYCGRRRRQSLSLIECTNYSFTFILLNFTVPMFAPEGLTCSPVNAHSIQVNFQALPKAQARGVLTGYRIYVENADSEELGTECSAECVHKLA